MLRAPLGGLAPSVVADLSLAAASLDAADQTRLGDHLVAALQGASGTRRALVSRWDGVGGDELRAALRVLRTSPPAPLAALWQEVVLHLTPGLVLQLMELMDPSLRTAHWDTLRQLIAPLLRAASRDDRLEILARLGDVAPSPSPGPPSVARRP